MISSSRSAGQRGPGTEQGLGTILAHTLPSWEELQRHEPVSDSEDTLLLRAGSATTLQVPGTRAESDIPVVAMETKEELP